MKKFAEYLLIMEAKGFGLPHISTMDRHQFHGLTKTGKVHIGDVTEKSDGIPHVMGYDHKGFYTQTKNMHAASEPKKMRSVADYHEHMKERAKARGVPFDPHSQSAFTHSHEILHKNKALQADLKAKHEKSGEDIKIKGELMYRPLSSPSEKHKDHSKFVGTDYSTKHMGSVGHYVIHTKLPENKHVDADHYKKHVSGPELSMDDDKLDHKHHHIDVASHVKKFHGLNHELLDARKTKTNKDQKEAEEEKFSKIKKAVSDKVDAHIHGTFSKGHKWGKETEGHVVHPSEHNKDAPRFKVTSPGFRDFKKNSPKVDFAARLKANQSVKESGPLPVRKNSVEIISGRSPVYGFLRYISEGGNVGVKNKDSGEEHKAGPIHVPAKNREEIQHGIHAALSSIHQSFHAGTGYHLFGKDAKALHNKTAYSGSSKHLMDPKISHDEYAKHKPKTGDVDVLIPHEHKDALAAHLKPGQRHGPYTVMGTKKHGTEVSAVMKHHKTGENHQIDFESSHYKHDEPTKGSAFLHSSSWEDTHHGVKGLHHKALINAAAGETHKFSITHGLRSRTDEHDSGKQDPKEISQHLFGKKADHSKIHSFVGVTSLIKHHIPADQHQKIYDKFHSGMLGKKNEDHSHALGHLKKELGVKDTVKEDSSEKEHHTSVIPMMGLSPISHMGHAHDLGGAMKKLPGTKHVGISAKADSFTAHERVSIMKRQWKDKDVNHHIVKSGGEMVAHAYHALPKDGKKHLHMLVGSDRVEMAHGLKKSLEAGKIPEMAGHKFDHIHIHTPEDGDRTHGMSGTKMRAAAHSGDAKTFHKHLGADFSKKEAADIQDKVKSSIDSGKIKLKR